MVGAGQTHLPFQRIERGLVQDVHAFQADLMGQENQLRVVFLSSKAPGRSPLNQQDDNLKLKHVTQQTLP